MDTLNVRPARRNTYRTITCESCDLPAKIPNQVFFDALKNWGWEVLDIGGRDFYLCLLCQAQALGTRLAHCFEEKGKRARGIDAQEELRDLDSAIAQRKAYFSSHSSPEGESQWLQ
jgi:hypothetical protein